MSIQNKKTKICLTGGGTAGHVTPNIALVPTLQKRNFDIIYIGSKNGIEKGIVEENNIPFFSITSDKLRRYHDIKNLFMPINVIKGIFEAKKILKEQNVDIIFSKGGFVAVPVVIAAKFLKIPVVSHEADFTMGLANKIATPFSNKVCTNFIETSQMIKHNKGIYTGCPIRSELFKGNKENAFNTYSFKEKKPILLIVGGSLGSVFINNLIRENLTTLLKTYNIIHSCGKGKIDETLVNKYDGYRQTEMITTTLPDVFDASDFIISRAGANLCFEILALKKPNLLIPLSKRASRGDQILNANSFKKQGFSEVLFEEDAEQNKNLFLEKLGYLQNNKNFFIENMNSASIQNANEKIVDIIEETLNKN